MSYCSEHEYLSSSNLNNELGFDHCVKEFSDWFSLRKFLFDLIAPPIHESFGNWVFRGHANPEWPLTSSYERLVDIQNDSFLSSYHLFNEDQLISRVKREIDNYIKQEQKPDDDNFEWFSLLQHYGAATRLIDISESPFVSLFFSLENWTIKDNCVCLWAFNQGCIESQTYRKIFGPETMQPITPEQEKEYRCYPTSIKDCADVIVFQYPIKHTVRSKNQMAGFVYSKSSDKSFQNTLSTYELGDNVIKIIFSPNVKNFIHCQLDLQKMRIGASVIYPGLEGLLKEMQLNTKITLLKQSDERHIIVT